MSSCNCAQELTTVGRAVSQKIQLCHRLMLQYDEKSDKTTTMLQLKKKITRFKVVFYYYYY